MKVLESVDGKTVIVSLLKLFVVFLLPLEFHILFTNEGIDLGVTSQSYVILGSTISHIRYRWIIGRYPVSIILAAIALLFGFRLRQRRGKTYPIISAFIAVLVLAIIPVYIIIQFFLLLHFEWFGLASGLPVFVGFCSLLLFLFVILPTIDWKFRRITTYSKTTDESDNEPVKTKKRLRLTPKVSSYLIILAAFLAPGFIAWESQIASEYSYSSLSFIGFLLQGGSFQDTTSNFQISYLIQETVTWLSLGAAIAACIGGIIFAWTVMRYVYGKGSRKAAIFVGLLSLIPLIYVVLMWIPYNENSLILPIPIVFVLGLVILQFADVIESEVMDESEIKVPLLFRLKSRFTGHKEDLEKEQPVKLDNDV